MLSAEGEEAQLQHTQELPGTAQVVWCAVGEERSAAAAEA